MTICYQNIIYLTKLTPWEHVLALGVLLFLAIAIIGLGVDEHTGVTGKDEYYLGLRVPLCMREQQVWLVPCLDGEPRLRKPPMLYWLTRLSMEIFGPTLASARGVAVGFASFLVLAIAIIALELGDGLARAIGAGLIALSCLGLAVGGRILELDVPVATWSAWSYVWLLRWYRYNQPGAAILAAFSIAAGFLTKGPVVLVVCGAGVIALLATDPKASKFFRRHWLGAVGITALTTMLALPWFLYVHALYPDASVMILENELESRRFLYLSLVPTYGLLLLTLPWGFLALLRLLALRWKTTSTCQSLPMRALWLGLTLLPFCFLRSFERYLVGSLVPLALLLTVPVAIPQRLELWAARLGLILTLPLALLIQIAAWALGGFGLWVVLTIPTMIWFSYQWWQAQHHDHMAISAALFWACILGLTYPRLGINQVPPSLLELTQGREVVFYNGPQPAMLPSLLGRSLVHVDERWQLPARLYQQCGEFLLLSEETEATNALAGLKRLGFQAVTQKHFGILSAKVTWANMFRPGLTTTQLLTAITKGELEQFKPQVILYQVRNLKCQ